MSSEFCVPQLLKLSSLFFFHFIEKHDKGVSFLKHSVSVFSFHFTSVTPPCRLCASSRLILATPLLVILTRMSALLFVSESSCIRHLEVRSLRPTRDNYALRPFPVVQFQWQQLYRSYKVIRKAGIAIRYDTRCYFGVRSKADTSQLNLPHGTKN